MPPIPGGAAVVGGAREAWALARLAVRYPLGWPDAGLPVPSFGPGAAHGTPVVLIHGFGHNRSGWYELERALSKAGYPVVDSFNHVPWRDDVEAVAGRLADRVQAVRRLTGADRVHLVGHSLGGLVARWYVQELGGHRSVSTAVTIGTPHGGTVAAWPVPGRMAAQCRPGSALLRRLEAGGAPGPVRWVNYRSPSDLLVKPASNAVLRGPGMQVADVVVAGHGHLSLMISPRVVRSVVDQLLAADERDGMGTLAGIRGAARDRGRGRAGLTRPLSMPS